MTGCPGTINCCQIAEESSNALSTNEDMWHRRLPGHFLELEMFRSQRLELHQEILLMVQKSGVHQLRLAVYPVIYKVLYIPGGAGFLPSTVWLRVYLLVNYND